MIFNSNEHGHLGGIYQITNTHTGRVYIGQTNRFRNRWQNHCRDLMGGNHSNRFLQADYNKCVTLLGHDNFLLFCVLEVMVGASKEERNAAEERRISNVYRLILEDGTRACYNCTEIIRGEWRACHSKTPTETSAKQSEAMKKKWQEPGFKEKVAIKRMAAMDTPEYKAKASKHAKRLWESDEHRAAMSVLMQERMKDPNQRKVAIAALSDPANQARRTKAINERIASDPVFRAKKQEQARKNIANRNSTQPVKTYGSLLAPDGTIYHNISHVPTFAKEHGLYKQGLYALLHGRLKTHKGWKLLVASEEVGHESSIVIITES